jgi:hypothetical protein
VSDRKDELKKALGLEEEEENEDEVKPKKKWYHTKINWGFWVLIIGFFLWAIFYFIIKPRFGG